MSRTTQNCLTYSAQIDSWSLAHATVNANTTANPLTGAVDADTLVDTNDVSAQYHDAQQNVAANNCQSGKLYTLSVYAKAGTKSQLCIGESVCGAAMTFDLSAGTTLAGAVPISCVFWRIVPVSGATGWYRTSISFIAGASFTPYFMMCSSGTIHYQGDGTGTTILYGAQLVQGNWEGDYTTTSVTSAPYGLIFNVIPDKQNLFLYSEAFNNGTWWGTSNTTLTANSTINPIDGSKTAYTITDSSDGGSTAHHFYGAGIAQSFANHTCVYSLYVKAGTKSQIALAPNQGTTVTLFDLGALTTTVLSGNPLAGGIVAMSLSGWYRCWIRYTQGTSGIIRNYICSGGATSYTGDGTGTLYIFGAQLEVCNVVGLYTQTICAPYNYGARRGFAL